MAGIIAYIDGFNLYHGLRERYRHRYLWLDLARLVQRLRPNDEILAVRYFTAAVRNDPPAEGRQRIYLEALKAHRPEVQVVLGRYQSRQRTCHSCGATWTAYEEKETDVNIAVSLVADAAARAADIALLISADSDLCPAVRTVRELTDRMGTKMGLIAAFPPRRNSNELKALIPASFQLAQVDIRNSQLPDEVTDADGRRYRRPDKWR
ncbi:NYN domain-containing protein [Micromonospora orduensis]|uniref:NYN domain-containing protein n=1 Tax=Micromonospora orduensis TaxID=1420891 RepID=UPI0033E1EEBC